MRMASSLATCAKVYRNQYPQPLCSLERQAEPCFWPLGQIHLACCGRSTLCRWHCACVPYVVELELMKLFLHVLNPFRLHEGLVHFGGLWDWHKSKMPTKVSQLVISWASERTWCINVVEHLLDLNFICRTRMSMSKTLVCCRALSLLAALSSGASLSPWWVDGGLMTSSTTGSSGMISPMPISLIASADGSSSSIGGRCSLCEPLVSLNRTSTVLTILLWKICRLCRCANPFHNQAWNPHVLSMQILTCGVDL